MKIRLNKELVMEVSSEVEQAFLNAAACERAVKKIVKEVVREAEIADMASQAIWKAMEEEYKLDMQMYSYHLEGRNLYRQPIECGKFDEYVDRAVEQEGMNKGIKERLFGNKKKEK